MTKLYICNPKIPVMKRITGFIVLTALLIACNASDKKNAEAKTVKDSIAAENRARAMDDTLNYTSLLWVDSTFVHAGKIKEGGKVEIEFRFKNTGNKPLVFSKVDPSCGCTVAEKPEEPIAPGGEGSIKASFDSKNKKGNNRKHISVETNTKPSKTHQLEFEVVVE